MYGKCVIIRKSKKHINTCIYDLYGKLSVEIIKIQSKSHRKFKRGVSGPNGYMLVSDQKWSLSLLKSNGNTELSRLVCSSCVLAKPVCSSFWGKAIDEGHKQLVMSALCPALKALTQVKAQKWLVCWLKLTCFIKILWSDNNFCFTLVSIGFQCRSNHLVNDINWHVHWTVWIS